MTVQVDRGTGAVAARGEAERVEAIATRGFTERQARFLVTVMVHSGVFVGRQYAAFAGITHGQKVHDFIEKLLVRRFVTAIRLGSTGRKKIFHVHHKPLYRAIGEPDNRNRRPVMLGRAIERLMILDGVLADPSLTWLGSEHDKRHHFRQRLGDTIRNDEYPRLVFGEAPNQTIRYFPDKLPVGFERHGYRHVFLYPARSPSPMDFRLFLLRHLELLNALSHWTIRVLFPWSLASAMDTFEEAAYEHLAKQLQLSAAEELKWFFRQHQRTGQAASGADNARLRAARKEFRAPRFTALRRRWLEDGDRVIWLAASPLSRDALTRQRANVECVELPHSYDHFSSLGRIGGPQPGRARGMKLAGGAFPLSDHGDTAGVSSLVTT
jgi:hypothetical protein